MVSDEEPSMDKSEIALAASSAAPSIGNVALGFSGCTYNFFIFIMK